MNNVAKFLCLICIFFTLNANAQTYLISFVGTGESTTVNTVKVDNLVTGTSRTLNGNQILRLNVVITDINLGKINQSSELKIYPNPMTDNSIMQVYPPASGNAFITVSDISGKQIARIKGYLDNYLQEFRLSGFPSGFYLISVIGTTYQYSGKLICYGKSNGTIRIEKIGYKSLTESKKIFETNSKGETDYVDMPYTPGDILKYTSISGDYSTVSMDTPESDKTVTFNFISCTDGDNNKYPVVEIGSQTWMTENLKTSKYKDGISTISLITDNVGWGSLSTPGYCWYNNQEANYKDIYGALYNWYTISTGNLCPNGWHVPSDDEWATLIDNLGGLDLAGGKLKETGTNHWSPDNTGATDETGFTARPGGQRSGDGTFNFIGSNGVWWSSTETSPGFGTAWDQYMNHNNTFVNRGPGPKSSGYSVRCLKDQFLKSEEAYPGIVGTIQDYEVNGDMITCEKINNEYVFQGDIILTEEQLTLSGKSKGAGYSSLARLWPSGIVYYEINEAVPNQSRITDAIAEYEAKTNIEFIQRSDQFSYIEFVVTNSTDGSESTSVSSFFGMILGKQYIKLSDLANKGVVLHEIGHSIGLIHEHSRSDRDNYVIINAENIEDYNKYWQQFKKINNTIQTTKYDFYSIMGYDSWAFTLGPLQTLPTMTKIDGSTFNSNRERLTASDIEMINTLYPGNNTDIDGNVYTTVTIGTQTWMKENLKTTKFRDGTAIPNITGSPEWYNLTTGAYSNYDNNVTNGTTYGRLYNFYAIADSRKICPTGWHVPSDNEWIILTDYLTNSGYGYEGSGSDIAKSMASTSGWPTYSTPGTIGNDQANNNLSGFTALPAGARYGAGTFANIGTSALWWSSTESDAVTAWARHLVYININVNRYASNKYWGLSVRCLKDN